MYKILIVSPSWIGDVILSQSLLISLKSQYNNKVKIDIYANSWVMDILRRMPEVDDIILNPFEHGKLSLIKRIIEGRKLKKYNYDQVFVLPNSFKSAMVSYFSGIKRRTGFIGEFRYLLINDRYKLNKSLLPLMVDRYNSLAYFGSKAKYVTFPKLTVNKINQQILIEKFNIDINRKIVVFCPAAEFGPSKIWPCKYFAELAELIIDKYDAQIIMLASKKDFAITELIEKFSKSSLINLSGKTSLSDTVDIIALANCVISNDSGLMHVAAAVGSNLIAIYGSTSPGFTPPLLKNACIVTSNISCSPCNKRFCKYGHYNCLNLITPKIIFDKIIM